MDNSVSENKNKFVTNKNRASLRILRTEKL